MLSVLNHKLLISFSAVNDKIIESLHFKRIKISCEKHRLKKPSGPLEILNFHL